MRRFTAIVTLALMTMTAGACGEFEDEGVNVMAEQKVVFAEPKPAQPEMLPPAGLSPKEAEGAHDQGEDGVGNEERAVDPALSARLRVGPTFDLDQPGKPVSTGLSLEDETEVEVVSACPDPLGDPEIGFYLDFNEYREPLLDQVGGVQVELPEGMTIEALDYAGHHEAALLDQVLDGDGLTIYAGEFELTPETAWTVQVRFAWLTDGPIMHFRQGSKAGDSSYLDVVVEQGTVSLTDGLQTVVHPVPVVQESWHHLAVVSDGMGNVGFFIDGVSAGGLYKALNNWPKYQYLSLGHKSFLDSEVPYAGWFDELKIYADARNDFCW